MHLSRPADPRVRYPAQRTTSRRQRQHVFVILLLVSVPVLSCADGGRGAPRSQEHRVLPKLFPFVISFDNHARAKIRQVVNPPESPRRGCQWSARRCPRSSEVTSLVNTQTPKTRRAVIAILAPAKTSFPGLVCHSVGLVVQGCQFTALFHQTRSSWLCQQLKDRRPQWQVKCRCQPLSSRPHS